MKNLLSSLLILLFLICTLSVFAQTPDADAAKIEASTKRSFAGKKISIPGGATYEFKRNMTGVKSGGASGNLTVPFTWSVEGEFGVTKGSHVPGSPEEIIYWKFVNRDSVLAGKTKGQSSFTGTVSR